MAARGEGPEAARRAPGLPTGVRSVAPRGPRGRKTYSREHRGAADSQACSVYFVLCCCCIFMCLLFSFLSFLRFLRCWSIFGCKFRFPVLFCVGCTIFHPRRCPGGVFVFICIVLFCSCGIYFVFWVSVIYIYIYVLLFLCLIEFSFIVVYLVVFGIYFIFGFSVFCV